MTDMTSDRSDLTWFFRTSHKKHPKVCRYILWNGKGTQIIIDVQAFSQFDGIMWLSGLLGCPTKYMQVLAKVFIKDQFWLKYLSLHFSFKSLVLTTALALWACIDTSGLDQRLPRFRLRVYGGLIMPKTFGWDCEGKSKSVVSRKIVTYADEMMHWESELPSLK